MVGLLYVNARKHKILEKRFTFMHFIFSFVVRDEWWVCNLHSFIVLFLMTLYEFVFLILRSMLIILWIVHISCICGLQRVFDERSAKMNENCAKRQLKMEGQSGQLNGYRGQRLQLRSMGRLYITFAWASVAIVKAWSMLTSRSRSTVLPSWWIVVNDWTILEVHNFLS